MCSSAIQRIIQVSLAALKFQNNCNECVWARERALSSLCMCDANANKYYAKTIGSAPLGTMLIANEMILRNPRIILS